MNDDDKSKRLVAQQILAAIDEVGGALEAHGEKLATGDVYEGLGEAFIAFTVRHFGFDPERLSKYADQFAEMLKRTVSEATIEELH
ncbi:MAG TPA: hypothetical protein VKS78_17475 [Roseiarcus sp.]|nr:hypothetical protein [Roseiarcus sp.]